MDGHRTPMGARLMRKYHLLASIATLATATIGALPTSHPPLCRASADGGPAVPLVHTGLLPRQHCRLYLKCRCVPKDMAPEKWFGKVSTPRTDRDALDDVADGSADAAVVDDVELEAFRKAYPKTGARLRVLQQSEMFPAVAIAYQPGALNEETLKRLRPAIIAARTTPRRRKLLGLFHLTGFEEVPDDF